jgi:hypothetical protein
VYFALGERDRLASLAVELLDRLVILVVDRRYHVHDVPSMPLQLGVCVGLARMTPA